MSAASVSVRNYVVVTLAYWGFTLTDGALRMLVLLHFYRLGYSPFQLALLFVLYEALGAATNLLGGFLASRIGLKATLVAGLTLQVGALVMLSGLSVTWTVAQQVTYVLVAQGLSGIAKDLTKLSAKSAIKLVVPAEGGGSLFKWVALLTGSKNATKGVGFFAGGALLGALGFEASLWVLAGLLGLAIVVTATALPRELGRAKTKPRLTQLFSKSRALNVLSAARVFLFCARDVWFVVALPVFLAESLGWEFTQVGGYMAAWVVGYGVVQVLAPRLLRHQADENDAETARTWAFVLAGFTLLIPAALQLEISPVLTVLVGLGVFGVLFGINSALHSYLVLAYTDADQVAANVGFYYMANALGRLVGTLLSGLIYQVAGLSACLLAAGALLVASAILTTWLPDTRLSAAPRAAT